MTVDEYTRGIELARMSENDKLSLFGTLGESMKLVQAVYLWMLVNLPDGLRCQMETQVMLVELRDFIARVSKREAEDVQNEFEDLANNVKARKDLVKCGR